MRRTIRLAIVRQKYRFDGGGERFISNTLEALEDSELELNIITRYWPMNSNSNYYVHVCNPISYGRIARARSFATASKQYWQKQHFSLIQSHERILGCDIFRAGDGVHKAWLEQCARIFSTQQRWLIDFSPYHRYLLLEEFKIFNSHALKKIICNSKMVKNDIMNYYGISEDKCVLIYNAINSKKFKPASEIQRQVIREGLEIPKRACTLIFVGSGFKRKGLRQTLEAIAKTDRYLIVVGKDKCYKRYKWLARSLGCLSRIRFVGAQKEVLPYYHAADALILPTLYDPFPNVILEAMSCGLPVITSKSCGGSEFIEQGREGFFCDALDITSLRMFIAELPCWKKNSRMLEAVRKKVKQYTPAYLAYQLTTLYKQLLS